MKQIKLLLTLTSIAIFISCNNLEKRKQPIIISKSFFTANGNPLPSGTSAYYISRYENDNYEYWVYFEDSSWMYQVGDTLGHIRKH